MPADLLEGAIPDASQLQKDIGPGWLSGGTDRSRTDMNSQIRSQEARKGVRAGSDAG
jgi:hypothetical protein